MSLPISSVAHLLSRSRAARDTNAPFSGAPYDRVQSARTGLQLFGGWNLGVTLYFAELESRAAANRGPTIVHRRSGRAVHARVLVTFEMRIKARLVHGRLLLSRRIANRFANAARISFNLSPRDKISLHIRSNSVFSTISSRKFLYYSLGTELPTSRV